MLDLKFWADIFKQQSDFNSGRRAIVGRSSDALHFSKQAIFALHRDNLKEAKEKLASATKLLNELDEKFGKKTYLRSEGSWKAGMEEFCEAQLFMNFCEGKKIGEIKNMRVEADEYIGGLCDVCGEIVRKMVGLATEGKIKEVKKANEALQEIIHELMQNNFSGYLRTKFDQAKRSLQKAEEIVYDISIRNK